MYIYLYILNKHPSLFFFSHSFLDISSLFLWCLKLSVIPLYSVPMRFLLVTILLATFVVLSTQDIRKYYNANWGDADTFMGNVFCDGHLASSEHRPKIAYCLSGGARTLSDRRVYYSMRKNLIEAFGGNPTVFAALRLEDVPAKGQRDYNFSSISVHDVSDLDDVFSHNMLNPSMVSYLPTVSDVVLEAESGQLSSECETGFVKIAKNRGRMVGMFEAIETCFDLVEEYEEDHEMKFDWVVRVRPDSLWTSSMEPYCFWHVYDEAQKQDPGKRNSKQHPDLYYFHLGSNTRALWDIFYMVKRDSPSYAMKPLSFYKQCKGREIFMNAEAFARQSFVERREKDTLREGETQSTIEIEGYNFPMTIIRNPHTCHENTNQMNQFDKNVLPHIKSQGRVEDVICYPQNVTNTSDKRRNRNQRRNRKS